VRGVLARDRGPAQSTGAMPSDTRPLAIAIRRALPTDAAALAEFAARTFADAFGAHNTPENMALYLAKTYGASQQAGEIANPAMTTILAECEGQLAGYAQLRQGPVPESVTGNSPIELLRFYVDRPWHGRGVARALLEAVDDEAMRLGAAVLWLAVWERNERAKAFYQKCGFVDVGSKAFVLGNDRQCDRVMARPIR
jgi:ribosomal protein S18 acetylase RimI-like enzyme